MNGIKNKIFSSLEKNIAISILNGMSISESSKHHGISKIKCQKHDWIDRNVFIGLL